MTEQHKEETNVFPLVKLNMVIVSAAPDTWWAGYQAGRLNQRDADEKALNERLDREKLARIIAEGHGWCWNVYKGLHRSSVDCLEIDCFEQADQIIKLIRGNDVLPT